MTNWLSSAYYENMSSIPCLISNCFPWMKCCFAESHYPFYLVNTFPKNENIWLHFKFCFFQGGVPHSSFKKTNRLEFTDASRSRFLQSVVVCEPEKSIYDFFLYWKKIKHVSWPYASNTQVTQDSSINFLQCLDLCLGQLGYNKANTVQVEGRSALKRWLNPQRTNVYEHFW